MSQIDHYATGPYAGSDDDTLRLECGGGNQQRQHGNRARHAIFHGRGLQLVRYLVQAEISLRLLTRNEAESFARNASGTAPTTLLR